MKLASFDFARLTTDILREIDAGGPHAVRELAAAIGVTITTVYNWRDHHIRALESVLSVCAYFDWEFQDYIIVNADQTVVQLKPRVVATDIDWELFATCCSNLCGGKPGELAEMADISPTLARSILTGDPMNLRGSGAAAFTCLLRILKLTRSDLHPSWRENIRRRDPAIMSIAA